MNHRDTKFFFKYNKFNFWCFVEKEKQIEGGGTKGLSKGEKKVTFCSSELTNKSFFCMVNY